MKKIAISTLNSKYIHASLSPWCLKAGLEAFGPPSVTGEVVEGTINQKQEDVFQKLKDYSVVAFSCYIWNIHQTKALAEALKENRPEMTLIFGGPEVGYHPERILEECSFVDFVLSGEGELPFAQLITALSLGEETFDQVYGLSYRNQQGEMIVGKAYLSAEEPPTPYCPSYFAQLQGRIAYLESSRGCPYACAFCLSGRGEGVRFFSLERVKGEIVALANSGTQTVKFVDRTFNSSVQHCDGILSFLLEEYGKTIPTSVCFHFEMAGDILRDSTLLLLKQMPKGYVQLEIGMQSFCEKTLEAVGRKTNISKLLENLQSLTEHSNHLHIDLIAGLPFEDLEEFSRSFNIAYSVGAEMLQLGFLKVLQGSEIGENPEKFPLDYDLKAPYQVKSTPWLSEEDFKLLSLIEDVVDRLYNSGRFFHTLAYLLQATSWDAFTLFREIGTGFVLEERISLERYMDGIFALCQGFSGVKASLLRDMLMIDRVETNSTGILPESLKIVDSRLRDLTIALEKDPQYKRPKHGKRFVGILYEENCGIYVDYPENGKKQKHFRERYQVHRVSLDILEKKEKP